jgi:hypothetical protein
MNAKRRRVSMNKEGKFVEGPEQDDNPVQFQAVKLAIQLHIACGGASEQGPPAAAAPVGYAARSSAYILDTGTESPGQTIERGKPDGVDDNVDPADGVLCSKIAEIDLQLAELDRRESGGDHDDIEQRHQD